MTADDTARIKERIGELGADLVGVTEMEPLREMRLDPPDLPDRFDKAISIAVQLPRAVFDMISDRPIPIYANVVPTANRILDDIAFRTAVLLQEEGYPSLPIPASQILDRENLYAAISHKAVARMAGLGWQGKNLLLITPKFGSGVRLTTVLTNAPLEIDSPLKNRCGKCTSCQDACPAEAIKGVGTRDRYKNRNEALHFSRCVKKLTGEFAAAPLIELPICGVCIKACPFGKKTGKI